MKKILLICPECNWMKLVKRAETDPKEAVYCKMLCPKCSAGDFADPDFYGDGGHISEPI